MGSILSRNGPSDKPGTIHVDVDYLVDYLMVKYTSQRTPYMNVFQFPAGSGVCVRDFRAQPFGGVDLQQQVKPLPSSRAELSERFRALLTQAIDDRLRPRTQYGAELSGGMDSSSVVCVADQRWRAEGRESGDLVTITFVSDDPSSRVDEAYLAKVNDRTRFRNVRIDDDDAGMLFPRTDAIPPLVIPDQAVGRQIAMAKLFRHEGIRTVITGEGGDVVGSAGQRPYAAVLSDLWRSRRLVTLYRQLLLWSSQHRRPMWDCLWHDCIRFRKETIARRGRVMWDVKRYVPWLRTNGERISDDSSRDRTGGDHLSTGAILFQEAIESTQYLLNDSRHILRPVRATHPFLDRRLIEFACSVPPSMAREPGRARVIQRHAMKDVLPAEVLDRRHKRGFDDEVYRHLCHCWKRVESMLNDDNRLAAAGVVDIDALRTAADSVRNGDGNLQAGFHRLISLELWLRNVPAQVSL